MSNCIKQYVVLNVNMIKMQWLYGKGRAALLTEVTIYKSIPGNIFNTHAKSQRLGARVYLYTAVCTFLRYNFSKEHCMVFVIGMLCSMFLLFSQLNLVNEFVMESDNRNNSAISVLPEFFSKMAEVFRLGVL